MSIPMKQDDEYPKVEKINKKRLLSGIGRRRFTKTLLSFGFGSMAARHLTVDDVRAAASDEVPIVVGIETPDDDPTTEIPHKKYVPADWYNDYLHATDVFKKYRESLLQIPNVKGVWFQPGEYGGHNSQLKVEIDKDNAEKARGEVPESINEVPIAVHEVGETRLADCSDVSSGPNYNDEDQFSSVPGGVVCRTGDVYGTLSGRVYSVDHGREFFMVSNHLYGGQGEDHKGEPLYHPDVTDDDVIGEVFHQYCYDDYALISPKSHNPVRSYEDAQPSEDIRGWFTRSGLSDLKAAGESIEKYGVRTGRTSGQIESTDGATSSYGCKPKDGQLQWGTNDDFCDGDSGSLAYHAPPDGSGGYESDRIWICGMNNARTADWSSCCANYVWGPAAWKLNVEHNLRF